MSKARVSLLVLVVITGLWAFWPGSGSRSPLPRPPQDSAGERDVIVAFTAPWCGACREDKPVLRRLAEYNQVVFVNTDDIGKADRIPFYIVYRDGVEIFRTYNVEDLE